MSVKFKFLEIELTEKVAEETLGATTAITRSTTG